MFLGKVGQAVSGERELRSGLISQGEVLAGGFGLVALPGVYAESSYWRVDSPQQLIGMAKVAPSCKAGWTEGGRAFEAWSCSEPRLSCTQPSKANAHPAAGPHDRSRFATGAARLVQGQACRDSRHLRQVDYPRSTNYPDIRSSCADFVISTLSLCTRSA